MPREEKGDRERIIEIERRYSREAGKFLEISLYILLVFVIGITLSLLGEYMVLKFIGLIGVLMVASGAAGLIISLLFTVGSYAQLHYYRDLLDGGGRGKRWLYCALFSFVAFLFFLALGSVLERLSIFFLAVSIVFLVLTVIISAGYLTYTNERDRHERTQFLKRYGLAEENVGKLERIFSIILVESIAAIFSLLLSIGLYKNNSVASAVGVFVAAVLVYLAFRTYRKNAQFFRKMRDMQRKEFSILYMKYLEEEKGSERIIKIKKVAGAFAMFFNYILWISLLYEIITQPLPVNCGNAMPEDMGFYILGWLIITAIIFWVRRMKFVDPVFGAFLFIYFVIFVWFVFSSSVASLCICWDFRVIAWTYFRASFMFTMDTALKAVVVTGLEEEVLRKKVQKWMSL